MYVCMYVCMCMYVCVCANVSVRMYLYECMCVCVCVCAYVYVCDVPVTYGVSTPRHMRYAYDECMYVCI